MEMNNVVNIFIVRFYTNVFLDQPQNFDWKTKPLPTLVLNIIHVFYVL